VSDEHDIEKSELILSNIRSLAIKRSGLVKRGLEGIQKLESKFDALQIIIIADDDPTMREVLGELCSKFLPDKYQVLSAGSAEEAIEFFLKHEHQIAAVVTNHIMPGITGAEFIEWIQEFFPHIPTVLNSGYLKQEEFSNLSIAKKPDCRFIKKPIHFDEFQKILIEVIEKKKLDNSWPDEGSSKTIKPKVSKPIDLYKSEIARQITEKWVFSQQVFRGRTDLEAVLVIKILPNGEIRNIWFEKKSGNSYLDESAFKAVKKSNPLPPLPKEFRRPFYNVGLVFTPYGLKK